MNRLMTLTAAGLISALAFTSALAAGPSPFAVMSLTIINNTSKPSTLTINGTCSTQLPQLTCTYTGGGAGVTNAGKQVTCKMPRLVVMNYCKGVTNNCPVNFFANSNCSGDAIAKSHVAPSSIDVDNNFVVNHPGNLTPTVSDNSKTVVIAVNDQ